MKKTILIIFLSIVCSNLLAQQKAIYGVVRDSAGLVSDVNIVNLKSKIGTVSNQNGEFMVFASLNDTIQLTSIQHITQKIVINPQIYTSKNLSVFLILATYQLDEFDLKRTELEGSLSKDLSKVKHNKKDSLLRAVMDFSKVNMKAPVANDYIDERVRPNLVKTDPTQNFATAGATMVMPFKYSERLWALRRDLDFKKSFPYKILLHLGEKFFFEDLKIPVDNYFHFLEYCNPLGIENLYLKKNHLEVIKILREESVGYLKIINEKK